MTQINNPIFIIGPGRSGTTLTLQMMSIHPDLAWFSGWTDRLPSLPQLSVVSRLNDVSFLEKLTRGLRKWPRPSEAYHQWNSCFPGFSLANEEWRAEHVTPWGAGKLKRTIESHLFWQRKTRFLTKITGWPRIEFIRTIFPDSLFVYVDRDPRAVVYSYLKQQWWMNEIRESSIYGKLRFYADKYLGIYNAKKRYSHNEYIQIFYEQIVQNPSSVIKDTLEKCNLIVSDRFVMQISAWRISGDTNRQWKQHLSPDEK